ncbi:hypothetical protein IAQ61_011161 [Plenodomus lingam]|uniref:uncharacterized protein n=1 Tax=Leptosphaeria maculans TaxID=5022 RepID=UPI0033288E71|nr:hypothetical protein IAQ61_011161 [Plenodomus lingam]
MMLFTTTFSIYFFAAISTAVPSTFDSRQSGGSFVSVGNKYSGPGCTDSTLIFADPIFGNGNVCQVLDRSGTNPPIISYITLSAAAGCSVTLYTGADCSGTAYSALVGGCVTGSAPFVSTYVTCV